MVGDLEIKGAKKSQKSSDEQKTSDKLIRNLNSAFLEVLLKMLSTFDKSTSRLKQHQNICDKIRSLIRQFGITEISTPFENSLLFLQAYDYLEAAKDLRDIFDRICNKIVWPEDKDYKGEYLFKTAEKEFLAFGRWLVIYTLSITSANLMAHAHIKISPNSKRIAPLSNLLMKNLLSDDADNNLGNIRFKMQKTINDKNIQEHRSFFGTLFSYIKNTETQNILSLLVTSIDMMLQIRDKRVPSSSNPKEIFFSAMEKMQEAYHRSISIGKVKEFYMRCYTIHYKEKPLVTKDGFLPLSEINTDTDDKNLLNEIQLEFLLQIKKLIGAEEKSVPAKAPEALAPTP